MNGILHVDGIELQRDEYRTRDDRLLTDGEFVDSALKSARVEHFKRFVVKARIMHEGRDHVASIQVSLRGAQGHLLTVSGVKDAPFGLRGAVVALQAVAARFAHKTQGEGNRVRPIEIDRTPRDVMMCTVSDGYWFADVLHHVGALGGVEVPLKVPPPILSG